ncbi:MAG: carbonic anhydrase [Leptolyngbyaceae cyanobacterium RU_5_1]|nr:carbonic anhydrase [Leptolyngbyaceae cyanobacterium RU_5_1]
MSQINGFIGRRHFLNRLGMGGIGSAAMAMGFSWNVQVAQANVLSSSEELTPESPEAALKQLLDGNQRFVQQKGQHPHQSRDRLQEVALAQHPYATVLSCADSRVPVEIVFDQGVGDLFDIRVAGNIITPEVLGSLEYAAVILETPLIMVLGHERCGAVTAAVANKPLPGQIGTFVKAIKPAIAKLDPQSANAVENAVVANIQYQVEATKRSSDLLAERISAGKLKIVGGRYDLDTGEVQVIA